MPRSRGLEKRRNRYPGAMRICGYGYKEKSKTTKRTVLKPKKGDRRYLRRNKKGEFGKQVKVGRSLAADRKRTAKTKVKKGQGDRGDVAK